MAFLSRLPMEIICEIITTLPFSKIIDIINLNNDFSQLIIENLDYFINNYIDKIKDKEGYYFLYNSLYLFYETCNIFVPNKIIFLRRINDIIIYNRNIPNYDTRIQAYFIRNPTSPEFIKKFYELNIIYAFPIEIALRTISHMNMTKINRMLFFLSYYRHVKDYQKYQDAYDAVFDNEKGIYYDIENEDEDENADTENDIYSFSKRINTFKLVASSRRVRLIDAINVSKNIMIEELPVFFELINRNISPNDICNLFLGDNLIENKVLLEQVISLILQYKCTALVAMDVIEELNQEQRDLFKKIMNTIDVLEFDRDIYNLIEDKNSAQLKCINYLVERERITLEEHPYQFTPTFNFISNMLSEDQCNKMLELIESGINFYNILKNYSDEQIISLLQSLIDDVNLSFNDAYVILTINNANDN